MKNVKDKKYPGMTEFFRIGGISAQAQLKHAIRSANKYTKIAAFKCVKFRA